MLLSHVKNWTEPFFKLQEQWPLPTMPPVWPIPPLLAHKIHVRQIICCCSGSFHEIWWQNTANRSGVNESYPHMTWVCTCSKITLCQRLLNSVHLQPLDGLLAAWAEHDAVVQAGDGSCTAGQCWQRRRGTHPRHGIGHCGEIIPLIHSLAFTVIVLVIG